MVDNIAKRWRQLSGEEHWKNILDPLDIDLRRYLVHYGDMAHITYDTFNTERASKFCGSSRYGKADLLSKVGLVKTNPLMQYQITKFFYATSSIPLPATFFLTPLSREAWCKESNWMGYVAVATDDGKKVLGRRDIVIAWRGTVQPLEWLTDLEFGLVPGDDLFGEAANTMIHEGWHSMYTSDDPRSQYNKSCAREQLYKKEEMSITVVGHSLGASMATLSAADIVANGLTNPKRGWTCPKPILVTAFAFASPRVGDLEFRQLTRNMHSLRVLRVTNNLDLVTTYPLLGYADIGEELRIDTLQSPYVRNPGSTSAWHNLQAYLHGIAGTQGLKGGFKLEIPRDIALLNRTIDGLKDNYGVPIKWWCEKNKGMIQQANGCWVLHDHEEIEIEM
ncbi:hypothetical protein ACHQM5_013768 [Ranunculus cassubicifolius]